MGNCHFKSDFDAENFTGKLLSTNIFSLHFRLKQYTT